MIVTRSRHYAGPYVVAPTATLGEPLLACLPVRTLGPLAHLPLRPRAAARTAAAQRLATASSDRRDVRVSVLSDAGELRDQPVQIDGDDALTLPVSIGLAAGAVRLLRPA